MLDIKTYDAKLMGSPLVYKEVVVGILMMRKIMCHKILWTVDFEKLFASIRPFHMKYVYTTSQNGFTSKAFLLKCSYFVANFHIKEHEEDTNFTDSYNARTSLCAIYFPGYTLCDIIIRFHYTCAMWISSMFHVNY